VFDVRLLARRSISYRNNSGYDLTIDHLPANRRYSVERCRISAAHDFTSLGATVHRGGPIRLQDELPPPGIELVTIRTLDVPPGAAATRRPAPTNAETQDEPVAAADDCAAQLTVAAGK
jgi:hypothetical protein